jgi:hypothetical protein
MNWTVRVVQGEKGGISESRHPNKRDAVEKVRRVQGGEHKPVTRHEHTYIVKA